MTRSWRPLAALPASRAGAPNGHRLLDDPDRIATHRRICTRIHAHPESQAKRHPASATVKRLLHNAVGYRQETGTPARTDAIRGAAEPTRAR